MTVKNKRSITNVINIFNISWICVLGFCHFACQGQKDDQLASGQYVNIENAEDIRIVPGAERISRYFPMIQGKRIALTVNHSSRVGEVHLVDTLLKLNVQIMRIFAPEHGFRGTADAGAQLEDQTDTDTGLDVISLYGSKLKPGVSDLENVDVMIFDIQDTGVRFYTYISTLHYMMQACAEQNIPLILLDRPNPNGYYVDGPVLEFGYQSFVGMHPIPVVYGLTIGELATMIQGEGWLGSGLNCDLTIVPCANYDHGMMYDLPIAPSPNLPNLRSVLLYPSLCLFEPTTVSVGRGTEKQFQVVGHPSGLWGEYGFTPVPKPGASRPKHDGIKLTGYDLTELSVDEILAWKRVNLDWLVEGYASVEEGEAFFKSSAFFDKLAGTDVLRKQIIQGMSPDAIRLSWQEDLQQYRIIRKKYLLYPDF